MVGARRCGRRSAFVAVGVLLTACAPEEAAVETPSDPVVVYAAFNDKTYLPALLDAYTKETGTIVIVRHGEPRAIVDDVIENEISPPADVLLTPSVRGIYRAAEEGALRPMRSEIVTERVPMALRDPDNMWLAISYRKALIVHSHNKPGLSESELPDVTSLGLPEFSGQCLSSSALPINRAVIATLIDIHGVRRTEIIVRGWVSSTVFDAEDKLLDAIGSGKCGFGIASSTAISRFLARGGTGVSTLTPATDYVDIDGIGIARHARNPDGAAQLIEWLLRRDVQERHAEGTFSSPVTDGFEADRNIGLIAWLNDDAIKLAERARYR